MLLDRQQIASFCRYLETQIASNKGIVEQMKNIRTPEAVVRRYQIEQAACEVVLRMLQSTEEMSVGAGDSAGVKP